MRHVIMPNGNLRITANNTDRAELSTAYGNRGSDATMLAGGPIPHANASVWWYPDYMIRDPWKELKNRGFVIFTKATD